MPWTLNENNQYNYNYNPQEALSNQQKEQIQKAADISTALTEADALDAFLKNEVLKDITFTHINTDGTEEEKTVKSEEVSAYLSKFKEPFSELGRGNSLGTNLMGFAIKNGMTIDELDIVRTNPNHPNYKEYKEKLENARKDMFKTGTCEEPERAKQGAVDFYVEYCNKFEEQLNTIRNSDTVNDKDIVSFNKLAGGFQTLFCQTLKLGEKKKADRAYGENIASMVNQRLSAEGKPYNFDCMYNFGSLANIMNQSALGIRDMIKNNDFHTEKGYSQSQGEMLHTKFAYAINEFRAQLRDPNKNIIDIISTYTNEYYGKVYGQIQNTVTSQNLLDFEDPEAYQKMETFEAQRQDLLYDSELLNQGNQKTSKNFKSDLESLVNGFSSMNMKKAGKEFNSLVGGVQYLANCVKNNLNKDSMVQMLRAVQNDANNFIKNESSKDTPNAQQLRFANNLFKLAGTEKITLRDNLQRGITLKGAEVNAKDTFTEERDLDLGKVTTLAKELESVDPAYLISSEEFKNTKKALYSLKDQLGKYQKNPNDEELAKVRNAYKKVADNCKLYTMTKTGKELNANGQKRFDFINKLNSFVSDKFTGISDAMHKHIYTNREMADVLNENAFKSMNDEFNKAKPDFNKVKIAIAAKEIGRRIKAADGNAIYNSALSKKMLPELLKSKEVEKELKDFKNNYEIESAKKNNNNLQI